MFFRCGILINDVAVFCLSSAHKREDSKVSSFDQFKWEIYSGRSSLAAQRKTQANFRSLSSAPR